MELVEKDDFMLLHKTRWRRIALELSQEAFEMLVNSRIVGCGVLLALATLAPLAVAQPIFTTLYTGGSATPLVLGTGGVLYGFNGAGQIFPECPAGCSGVFELMPPASAGGSWTETIIYSFTSVQDGIGGYALIKGTNDLLYGVTGFGGTGCKGQGCGTVFSLAPPAVTGAPWTKKTYAFTGPNLPNSLVLSNGVLYGTSRDGGTASQCSLGCGTFFSVTPPSGSQNVWSQHVLHSFAGGGDAYPVSLIAGSNGEFFGTAGDVACPAGCSYVFSMTQASAGGPWKETVLYTDTDTSAPDNFISVVLGSNGIIYGTTTFGGAHGLGSVFSLTPPSSAGGAWAEATLYSFTGVPDASQPNPALVIGPGGVLYGTSYFGGTKCPLDTLDGCGTVFSLTPPAKPGGAWTEKVLYRFSDGNDGAWPTTGVTLGQTGVLYGSTSVGPGLTPGGLVFSLQP